MTVKLLLLKSAEDIIADVQEMVAGEGDDQRVIGYFLNKPCVVKMHSPSVMSESGEEHKKAGFQVSLTPWIPLSKDDRIPIPADWMVTMVEPLENLKLMYIEDVMNHGKDNQSDSTGESTDSNQSD